VQILDGRGRHPLTAVGVSKLEWLPFCVVSKYLQCIIWLFGFVTKRACDRQTDGWTDGRTELREHSCSRCKNC